MCGVSIVWCQFGDAMVRLQLTAHYIPTQLREQLGQVLCIIERLKKRQTNPQALRTSRLLAQFFVRLEVFYRGRIGFCNAKQLPAGSLSVFWRASLWP